MEWYPDVANALEAYVFFVLRNFLFVFRLVITFEVEGAKPRTPMNILDFFTAITVTSKYIVKLELCFLRVMECAIVWTHAWTTYVFCVPGKFLFLFSSSNNVCSRRSWMSSSEKQHIKIFFFVWVTTMIQLQLLGYNPVQYSIVSITTGRRCTVFDKRFE